MSLKLEILLIVNI